MKFKSTKQRKAVMAKMKKLTPLQDLRIQVAIARKAGFYEQPRIKKQLAALRKAKRR